jgi:hypothetical protein
MRECASCLRRQIGGQIDVAPPSARHCSCGQRPATARCSRAAPHGLAGGLCGPQVSNAPAVVRFALRGPGKPGPRPVGAPLSDPTALPDLEAQPAADGALRHVVHALLAGVEAKQVPGCVCVWGGGCVRAAQQECQPGRAGVDGLCRAVQCGWGVC